MWRVRLRASFPSGWRHLKPPSPPYRSRGLFAALFQCRNVARLESQLGQLVIRRPFLFERLPQNLCPGFARRSHLLAIGFTALTTAALTAPTPNIDKGSKRAVQ
jgi:hypothetical protein